MNRNIQLYPWFKFVQNLVFWQATWFLYFEHHLSAAEAILLYVVYDIGTTALEVPSGYMSDRIGRKLTLIIAALFGVAATFLLVLGDTFLQFAFANVMLAGSAAFASGTDSALLYESLRAKGREAEIEAAELKAWRFSFAALALSALMGGALALFDDVLPYIATAMSAVVLLALTTQLKETPYAAPVTHLQNMRAVFANFSKPALLWILGLTLLMYVFSHIPFVFGQPFIREALDNLGYAAQVPLVSGGVTFLMMVISLCVSLIAPGLRQRLGLTGIVLLAFGLQIALTAALAASNSLFVIALLFLRMVPDSLSQPFIRARIQPLLEDGTRATYMSLQSLAGRILFAITLSLAALRTSGSETMAYADLQVILTIYVMLGVIAFGTLVATARRAGV